MSPQIVELKVSSIHPRHPERVCWGCEKLCPVNHLMCRETRAAHPAELFGDDWWEASNPQPTAGAMDAESAAGDSASPQIS